MELAQVSWSLSATLASLLLFCNFQLLGSLELCALFLYSARAGPSLLFVAVSEMFPRESWEECGVYWCLSLLKNYNLMFPYGVQLLKIVAHVSCAVVQFIA